jgi:hypothetical protein
LIYFIKGIANTIACAVIANCTNINDLSCHICS